jgi:hypothetical protein
MKLRQLLQGLEIVGCAGDADREGEVSSVCYAASQCGRDSLFVAIPGLVHDGHDFIGQAIERGARCIVHSRDMSFPAGIAAIRVADSRRALGRLARNFFGDPSTELTLVGITERAEKPPSRTCWNRCSRPPASAAAFWGRSTTGSGEKSCRRPTPLRNPPTCKDPAGDGRRRRDACDCRNLLARARLHAAD